MYASTMSFDGDYCNYFDPLTDKTQKMKLAGVCFRLFQQQKFAHLIILYIKKNIDNSVKQ